MSLPEDLANLMRHWRDTAGLTTTEAGERLSLSRRTIEGIEQGRGFPSAPVVLEIALKSLISRTRKKMRDPVD